MNKNLKSGLIIIVILLAMFFVVKGLGFGAVTSAEIVSGDKIEFDTQIKCSSTSDCQRDSSLSEIKDIVYCSNTCKFLDNKNVGLKQ